MVEMYFICIASHEYLLVSNAQKILGYGNRGIDWGRAIIAGLVGSFVGGLVTSQLAGDGLDLRPSGIIGSILGAVIVTFLLK